MSYRPSEKRVAEGVLESERQKRLNLISDLKESLVKQKLDTFMFKDNLTQKDPIPAPPVVESMVNIDDTEKLDTFMFKDNLTKDPIPAPPVVESMINRDETEKPMRLLISNGYEICVVDIKDNPISGVDYLPKIATLNLVENQLPVSVGLFRIGSDAYMIGGQTFPDQFRATDHTDIGYSSFIDSLYVNGTSCDTYSLSISNNGTLLYSKCDMLNLKIPKVWPVVAEIEDKLHVFDSFPLIIASAHPLMTSSHEIINSVDTIETPSGFFIRSHLVLGHRIFAATVYHMSKNLSFDSTNLKWEVENATCGGSSQTRPPLFKTVLDILSYYRGKAICVHMIEFQNDSYYLVLALLTEYLDWSENDLYDDDDVDLFRYSYFVVAYLVESSGNIVGRQTLHGFFNGPVQPSSHVTSAIIKGGGTDGKTMCVALTGAAIIGNVKQEDSYFFSNTFTVEVLNCNIKRILKAKNDIAKNQELVRIHIKDRCVYKIDENDLGFFGASSEVCFF